MSTDPAIRALASRLAKLEALLEQQSAPGLANSSMEGGAVRVYKPGTGGATTGVELGQQYDGNYGAAPLVGLLPPTPTKPTVRVVGNVVFVAWDGHYADSPFTVAPSDWKETEIHIGPAPTMPNFGVVASTLVRPAFTSARGGEIGVAGLTSGVDYYAVLTARSTPGRFSAPSEVVGPIRVGTIPSVQLDASQLTYLGGVDPAGSLVASTDDTGRASYQGLDVNDLPSFAGVAFDQWIQGASGIGNGLPPTGPLAGAQHWYGANNGAGIGNVTTEVGLIEMPVTVTKGRAYLIFPDVEFAKAVTTSELRLRIRDAQTAAPSMAAGMIYYRQFSNSSEAGYGVTASSPGLWTPQYTGQHRLLLTAEGAAGAVNIIANSPPHPDPTIYVLDLGPFKSFANTVTNRGGGGTGTPPPPPPPAVQQRYVDLPPVGRATWRGDGSLFPGGADVYQGYDAYAGNGDMAGMFWFDLPDITGTVDRVDVYMYFRHWYYNSGGQVKMNVNDGRGTQGRGFFKPFGDFITGGWPKPGSQTVTLPSGFYNGFRGVGNAVNNGRFSGITLGPGGGTNQLFYGVATDCRLRIWYTQ